MGWADPICFIPMLRQRLPKELARAATAITTAVFINCGRLLRRLLPHRQRALSGSAMVGYQLLPLGAEVEIFARFAVEAFTLGGVEDGLPNDAPYDTRAEIILAIELFD